MYRDAERLLLRRWRHQVTGQAGLCADGIPHKIDNLAIFQKDKQFVPGPLAINNGASKRSTKDPHFGRRAVEITARHVERVARAQVEPLDVESDRRPAVERPHHPRARLVGDLERLHATRECD